MDEAICSECGGMLEAGKACREYLDEMIKWDFEDFAGVGQVHHLTVLSYNLQHPSVYSNEGLDNAKKSLVEFMRDPLAYARHGAYDRKQLGSDVRTWKIAGTEEEHAAYASEPLWTMHASDVVRGGLSNYVENVKKWSDSVIDALRASGNLG